MTALLVAEGVAILLLAILVIGLLRSHAEILRALHRLGDRGEDAHDHAIAPPRPRPRLGSDAAMDVAGQSLQGSAVHVGVSGSETRTMLAFLSSGCTACLGLWRDLRDDHTGGLAGARLVVVTKGAEAESQSRLVELAPDRVTVVQSSQAWSDYAVPVTPYFVLVDGPSGRVVGEGSAASWGQVASLMGQAIADREALEVPEGEFRADSELRKAGIGPGHPSLYPEGPPVGDQ